MKRICIKIAALFGGAFVLMAIGAEPGLAGDPAYYTKKATWHDSMVASAEAISASGLADGFAPFESGTMRGGDASRQVSINIAGAQELWLFVTGIPDVKWGVADWADPRLIRKDGSVVGVTTVSNVFKVALGRHEQDLTLRAGLYQKIHLGGRKFDRGINVQANSAIVIPLAGAFEKFEAIIGVDDWAGTNGAVRFSVLGANSGARKRLWEFVARDFADARSRQEMRWEREDRIHEGAWRSGDFAGLAGQYASGSARVPELAGAAAALAKNARTAAEAAKVRALYYRSRELGQAASQARTFDFESLRLAISDLEQSFPGKYAKKFGERFTVLQREVQRADVESESRSVAALERLEKALNELEALKSQALLANPLLDFERLIVVKRKPLGEPRRSQWEGFGLGEYLGVPRQSSWGNGTMPNVDKWTNEIAVVSPARPDGAISTLFKPDSAWLISDVDLNFDGQKMSFAMPDARKKWQIFELGANGSGLKQLTPSEPDVHWYDPCYLPSGKILMLSTAPMQGVPCNAGVIVGMMYQMDGDGKNIRQVCFEQDHDYNPSVMNDGRVLYLRWDYTDTPHIWNRILFTMNPDGTSQMGYYGGNSYWPNAVFYPRAIPGHPTKIAGIVTGHHEGRVGELVVFDPARGTQETQGVVQAIPGRRREVKPLLEDKLTEHSWPKFLHPWPLSEKYFLVAAKPTPDSLWGIYLVDVFDNMTLIREEEGWALLEPMPFRARPAPPVIPDRVKPDRDDALVYMEDVYFGPGLKDVPRGTVKSLRLFSYHFGFQTLAGIDHRVGADGPWEAKRVLGTVPVEEDGSAWFRIPAQTPISLQPLDSEGKAIALMRSWMTAQRGENLSCIGCHEQSQAAPPAMKAMALKRAPSEIEPWFGPARGFSFAREVQPVLDRHCVRCHDGRTESDAAGAFDLRAQQNAFVVYQHGKIDGEIIRGVDKTELLGKFAAVFEPSYAALRQFVRVGGLESDLHLLPPREFHADTSELIQMLRKGHYDVRLATEDWERLATWIDLNAPCHGTWGDVTRLPKHQRERRADLRELYGGVNEDCEVDAVGQTLLASLNPVVGKPLSSAMREKYKPADAGTAAYAARRSAPGVTIADWPLTAEEARRKQGDAGGVTRKVDLGDGVTMELALIPAGTFAMGDAAGFADEQPETVARIAEPFWIGRFEISNEQFARFNPKHDSRFEHRSSWIFSEEYVGWRLNNPRQPVVRVSYEEAMAFCRWLSDKLGEHVTLPSEAQWEYACRAGTATPLAFGDLDTDFSPFANMADGNLRKLADEGWRPKAPDLVPRDSRFNDGALVTAEIGQYLPNAWGLHDMHGNAAEWTRTTYDARPVSGAIDVAAGEDRKVVRGGSWRDRPKLCRSASRLAYSPWQKIYNVGFRVVVEPQKQTPQGN